MLEFSSIQRDLSEFGEIVTSTDRIDFKNFHYICICKPDLNCGLSDDDYNLFVHPIPMYVENNNEFIVITNVFNHLQVYKLPINIAKRMKEKHEFEVPQKLIEYIKEQLQENIFNENALMNPVNTDYWIVMNIKSKRQSIAYNTIEEAQRAIDTDSVLWDL